MVHPLRAGEFGLSRTMHLHYNNIKKNCQNRTVLLWTMTYSDYPVDPKIRGENVWFWKSVVYIFILIYSLYKLGIFISRAQKRIHRTKNYLWKNILQCVIEFKSAAAAEKEACQEKTNFVCVRAFELPPWLN